MVRPRRRSSRAAAAALAAVAAVLLLAACGGGGSGSSSTASAPLDHATLVKTADSGCEAATKAAEKVELPSETPREINRYARELEPIIGRLIAKLEGLRAGGADKPRLAAYVAALTTGNDGLRLLAGAKTGSELTEAASEIGAQPVSRTAHALGAVACAKQPAL